MNVFALTLQPGPGTDVAVNREPTPKGFDKSLKQAMSNTEVSVSTEEEVALPDEQAANNLDLTALDPANALSVAGVNPVTGLVTPTVSVNPLTDQVASSIEASATSAFGGSLKSLPANESSSENPDLTLPKELLVKSIEVSRSVQSPVESDFATQANSANTKIVAALSKSQSGTETPAVVPRNVATDGIRGPSSAVTTKFEAVAVAMESLDNDSMTADTDGDSAHSESETPHQSANQPIPVHRLASGAVEPHASQESGVRDALRSLADRITNTVELKPQGEVRILLDSVDLGSIMTTVQVDGNRVDAKVKVQDERLGMVMQAQRQELFHRIEARGLSLDSFHVGQDSSNPSSSGHTTQEQSQEGQRHGQLISANTESAVAPHSTEATNWSPTTRWINTIA